MSATDSFTLFGDLPTELRLMIWSEALSVRSVWAAVFDKEPLAADPPPQAIYGLLMAPPQLGVLHTRIPAPVGPPPPAMAHVGPAPYLAGLACRESRSLLEQSHAKFLRGPGLATGSDAYWVDPESTIVYLGRGRHARATINAFGADELRQIRHIALRVCQYWSVNMTCMRLAEACPDLRTIIVHCDDLGKVAEPLVSEDLSPELAAYYASIPGSSIGLGDSLETLDAEYLVEILEPHFGDSPPTFHVVSPPFARRPGL